ncbi:Transposase domain protein [Leptospira santarosai]|nr:Transposase domain protein [Leptospira santarosai]
MKRKVYVGMDVHKETIQIAILPSNTKALVKEQQIKHEEGQIKKFIQKLKSEGTETVSSRHLTLPTNREKYRSELAA